LELDLQDYTSQEDTRKTFKGKGMPLYYLLHKIGNILFVSREIHRSLSHYLSRINRQILGRSYYPIGEIFSITELDNSTGEEYLILL
jgi:hypothetical protein